jgi:hypothetical protein
MSREQKLKRIIRLSIVIVFSVVFTLMFMQTGGLLHIVCAYGNSFLIEPMLKVGMDPGQTAGFQDWTPLHAASACGNTDAINLLIKYGADVQSTKSSPGWMPVHYAAQSGKIMAVMTLVNTHNGKEKTAEYLLISGAYPSYEAQNLAGEKGFKELQTIMKKIENRTRSPLEHFEKGMY